MSDTPGTLAPHLPRLPPATGVIATTRRAREVILCGLIASVAATIVLYVVPPGGDLAAHLYRTSLVQHGVLVWDNLWFSGQYPLASYSLLYYLLASVVGNAVLGVAGVAIAAGLFASIAEFEWKAIGRWPARAFAVLVTGQAFTAAYPYDLGLATLLVTLWALQRRRTWVAVCGTVLTLGFSPLAFLFLILALLALLVHRPRLSAPTLVVGAAVALAGGVQLAVLAMLPSPGLFYPYGTWRLAAGLAVASLGIALSLRGRSNWRLACIFAVWAAATIVAYVVPTPVGHNLLRASVFVVPLMLVAAIRAHFHPRWLAVTAVAAALAATVLPYAAMITVRSSSAGSTALFWRPVIEFLKHDSRSAFRVEVVPTANHWEAYYLPAAGIPLARGWYRQLDMADDRALYAPHLTEASYRLWLRRHAVDYVVLPHLPLEAIDATREANLLRSGVAGLREVWNSNQATIFALPHPTPILTGGRAATVTTLTSSVIEGWTSHSGTYLLRIHYMPYWTVTNGAICLTAEGAMTRLTARRAGRFEIQAPETLVACCERSSTTTPAAPPSRRRTVPRSPVASRRHSLSAQRISKPFRPSAASSHTSTPSTSAPRGPLPHQRTAASTASASPSNTASTAPSTRFRAHPETPRNRAVCASEMRKPTPCTIPRTTTWRLTMGGS